MTLSLHRRDLEPDQNLGDLAEVCLNLNLTAAAPLCLLMPEDREVLTVEFKVHFLKPAKADRVIAVGQVVQAGRTLTVCEGSVFDATRTRLLAK